MRLPPDRSILVVATAFGLFFVAAIAALTLIPPGSKIAPLWPATTLGVAVLLRMARGRGEAAAGLVGIALASILANTLVGKPWPLVLGFCIINTAEAALAAALARRFTSGTFKTLSDGWRFFAAAGPPAILMGGAGAYLLGRWVHPQAAVEMGVSFVASHLLGFTLAAPLAMTISRRELARLELRRRWLELSLVLALVLAAAMASFAQHSLPLLFATMPFALIATFRFRLLGANAAVLIIAAVAIPFTYAASGPLALVSAGGVSLKIAVLQAFLAATGLTVVPIAATLSERDRLGHLVQRQAEAHAETNRLLTRTLRSAEFAERAAGVGYWRMEYPSGAFMWSAGSYAIFERDPGLAPPHLSDLVLSVNRAEQEAVLAAFTHALANRTGFEADHSVVRPSGEVRHVHTRARFVDDEGPSRGVMLGVMVDVTDRTRAETAAAEASANYRLLAENATDVVIRYAAEDGRVLFVSPACEALIGLPPSDFIGRNSIGFVHEDDRARVAGAFARLASGELSRLPEPLEYRVRHADGRWVWVAGNPAPVRDPVTGWLENLVDVLRDVSARRALEDELIASREAAEAAARAKSDFLANMSHELRTPLSSIVGFSGLIAEAPELAPETRRRAALVAGASRSLVAVVNDVLEVSRFESEGVVLNPEPAHLGQVLGEAVELVRHDAESKGLELRFLPPASDPPVLMDALARSPDRAEPARQCGQVHAVGFGDAAGLRRRPRPRQGLGARHRGGHPVRPAGGGVRPLRAGRRLHLAQVRRHGARFDHQPHADRGHGGRDRRAQRAGPRRDLLVRVRSAGRHAPARGRLPVEGFGLRPDGAAGAGGRRPGAQPRPVPRLDRGPGTGRDRGLRRCAGRGGGAQRPLRRRLHGRADARHVGPGSHPRDPPPGIHRPARDRAHRQRSP